MTLLWLVATAFTLPLLLAAWRRRRLARLRRAGLYPAAGKATLRDVERLQRLGLTPWAIRCYREIRPCSLRTAKTAVESLAVDS